MSPSSKKVLQKKKKTKLYCFFVIIQYAKKCGIQNGWITEADVRHLKIRDRRKITADLLAEISV